MKFKKIYIEITNMCNLNCSFCSKTNRQKREITKEEFEEILKKIDSYTDYIYLHVKGEPLLHSDLDSLLDLASKYHKKVCITTNGTLLKEKVGILKKYSNIYQINISLHSENNYKNYLDNIFSSANELSSPYISYRFWTFDEGKMDEKTKNYLNKIKDKYQLSEVKNGIKLKERIYLSLENKFIWPDSNSSYTSLGYCYGGKTHLAILSDGTVTICCLDGEGESNLGNIFNGTIEDILSSEKYNRIVKSFQNRKAYLEICKHCSYKERFNKN